MEDLRKSDIIEDYSLTQTTLDEVWYKLPFLKWLQFYILQVFVQFASKQTELLQDEQMQPANLKQKIMRRLRSNNVTTISQNV